MRLVLLSLFFALATFAAQAQNPQTPYFPADSAARLYEITLKDGTKLTGRIVYQDERICRIQTQNLGEVTVQADQIRSLTLLSASDPAVAGLPNLFAHRLIYGQTARPLEKGRWYLTHTQFVYVPVTDFSVGLTNRWSFGANFISVLPFNAFGFKTKLTVAQSPRAAFALQANLYSLGAFNEGFGTLGGFQALGTFGSSRSNTTIGVGTFVADGAEFGSAVNLTLGFQLQAGKNLRFLSQNTVFISDGPSFGLLSAGLRWDRRRHAFDLSALIPIGDGFGEIIPFIPVGSYHLRLGK